MLCKWGLLKGSCTVWNKWAQFSRTNCIVVSRVLNQMPTRIILTSLLFYPNYVPKILNSSSFAFTHDILKLPTPNCGEDKRRKLRMTLHWSIFLSWTAVRCSYHVIHCSDTFCYCSQLCTFHRMLFISLGSVISLSFRTYFFRIYVDFFKFIDHKKPQNILYLLTYKQYLK